MKLQTILESIVKLIIKSTLVCLCLLLAKSALLAQTTAAKPEPTAIDMQQARAIIDSLDRQFSKDYLNGDSIALAGHYSNDA